MSTIKIKLFFILILTVVSISVANIYLLKMFEKSYADNFQAMVLNINRLVEKGIEAKEFFLKLLNANCERIAIENPIASKIFEMPKESQTVQPYWFGDPWSKKTRLWLRGLPLLKPTNMVEPQSECHSAGTWFMRGGKERQKNRAKTPHGLAVAMAEQWAGRNTEQDGGAE